MQLIVDFFRLRWTLKLKEKTINILQTTNSRVHKMRIALVSYFPETYRSKSKNPDEKILFSGIEIAATPETVTECLGR